MKLLIVFTLVCLSITGCASSRVTVDLNSCEERGQIDGIKIGSCEKVKVVK